LFFILELLENLPTHFANGRATFRLDHDFASTHAHLLAEGRQHHNNNIPIAMFNSALRLLG
jgi:hypothetical protein